MSKHIAKRTIGISRTGKRKDLSNWTLNEVGMANHVDRAAARAIRDLARERKAREKYYADVEAIHGGELDDDNGDIDSMLFE
jgi:hypothetical protein